MSIVLLTVEKGSLTAAAKALNMPLPTISRKVSELEAHLGTKLLQRSTRRLTLTDAGRSYVDGSSASWRRSRKSRELRPGSTRLRVVSSC